MIRKRRNIRWPRLLVSESESEWLYYVIDTLCKGQANLLVRSCSEVM